MIVPELVGSKYRLIVLAGQRVAQLQKGARPRVEDPKGKMKHTEIAMQELLEGLVIFRKKPGLEDDLDSPAAAAE